MAEALVVLLAFAAYSLFSKALTRTVLTLPILFTGLGLALSGPLHDAFPGEVIHSGKVFLAEATLILVLFADASHVRFRRLILSWTLPARMLVIGMPLTIAVGTVVAYWLNPASGLSLALLTAAVLTPTDAALGQAVVVNPAVPERLGQTINVESGLNDGLALPFVLLGATLASTTMGHAVSGGDLAMEAVREVVFGASTGIVIGWTAARAMDWAQGRDLMQVPAGAVLFLLSAFAAYLAATLVGGNGFIAAFVAGMVFGNTYRHDIHFIGEFMEGAGQLLTMAAFLVFGAFLLPQGLAHAGISTVLLAVLFLTVVRMLPIFLSLFGTGLPAREKLFLGWFGPRGLASILFTLLMMDEFDFPNEAELLACVSLTVSMSILLHGVSANPLARRIGHDRNPTPKGS
ncbi:MULTISPECIES: sodium:proton antiporter [unclassified Agrobacterium]|jgi:NhaP-type Na+/H+ or K+/H+ antiporter|uniref:cation:proton antiporter n=1 Tax=unclassified Agrobacterium TaxID=2632611 RepID=UPI00244AD07F|nr:MULTISPECIES: sodium:proton antiporter [unclassified Agrobacterium]MDH0615671.1 sodium:proton antiporter [Agrobacterium sp. GD03872]MDH0698810.1 sodium:proton antiporter [Agrobacterium sp. GD03871]MDH1061483.1 sodium:proton antiporter [Agrobacterium sp. GD03992]MDH2212582.1 sodium:proton antiporter [Agrobacterium sp. GD03643]MDH2221065.1 sodium:proton antiporter [Agrobacterium sp. GD03638]